MTGILIAQEGVLDDVLIITDEMTQNAEQNAGWKAGDLNYSAKPKNAYEVGIHVGGLHINGDVPSGNPCSPSAIGLHLRKAINYNFSWRLDLLYGTDKGWDGRRTGVNVLALDNDNINFSGYGPGGFTYRNFRNRSIGANLNLIFNIGNALFHSKSNKWNFYTGVGFGIMSSSVKMDYFDGSTPYNFDGIEAQFPENSSDKRSAIKDILDGDYESSFENDRDVPGFFYDSGKVYPQVSGLIGISRKINRRINISLEHQILAQDYDKLDGHEYRTTVDQTNDSDIIHYSNVRLGINLGNFDKATEPLYWLNPYEATFNDIAELKRRPILDLTDTDGDGVIDMMDQELETATGCAVDTRGVTLDSDGDGLADCLDKEIYSPPGYNVDAEGVADVPKPNILDENDVIRIISENCPGCKHVPVVDTGCSEWFLPMIHYDLNESRIKDEFYSQLHHVATVMKNCPELCIVAHGHTDKRASDKYNNKLSYNRAKEAIDYLTSTYGIDRSRIKLMYGGKGSPIVKNANTGIKNYMNRRVEFRTCEAGDYDMAMPEGAVRATETQGGIRYEGNKSSGY